MPTKKVNIYNKTFEEILKLSVKKYDSNYQKLSWSRHLHKYPRKNHLLKYAKIEVVSTDIHSEKSGKISENWNI